MHVYVTLKNILTRHNYTLINWILPPKLFAVVLLRLVKLMSKVGHARKRPSEGKCFWSVARSHYEEPKRNKWKF
jgi:hypothetical protein